MVKSAFQVCKVNDGDELIGIEPERPGSSIMFVTRGGICLNADASDVPAQGRVAAGVKGIQLTDGDVCLHTNRGFGKRVIAGDIDVMGRYRKGIKIIDFGKTRPSNGDSIVFASYVCEPYKIVMEDEDGYMIAFSTEDIVIQNRTQPGKQLFKGSLDIVAGYIYNDEAVADN